MKFVCDLLIMMFVAGTPFTAFMYEAGPLQFFVIISSFLQSIPWLCASVSLYTFLLYTAEYSLRLLRHAHISVAVQTIGACRS